mmetsp:Transcript_11878/g.26242  ORF Transcript_11878/g.26242 Transcript_11878/m.26242 type:complete len:317 (+) Transcript_11878:31-981(+)
MAVFWTQAAMSEQRRRAEEELRRKGPDRTSRQMGGYEDMDSFRHSQSMGRARGGYNALGPTITEWPETNPAPPRVGLEPTSTRPPKPARQGQILALASRQAGGNGLFQAGVIGFGQFSTDGKVRITWPNGTVTITAWPNTSWYLGDPKPPAPETFFDCDEEDRFDSVSDGECTEDDPEQATPRVAQYISEPENTPTDIGSEQVRHEPVQSGSIPSPLTDAPSFEGPALSGPAAETEVVPAPAPTPAPAVTAENTGPSDDEVERLRIENQLLRQELERAVRQQMEKESAANAVAECRTEQIVQDHMESERQREEASA